MIKYRYSAHSGYEVSEKGDQRFFPGVARMPDGKTIREHYRTHVFEKYGKNFCQEAYDVYYDIWRRWAERNFHLMQTLADECAKYDNTLRDSLAPGMMTPDTPGMMSHARILCQLLNEMEETMNQLKNKNFRKKSDVQLRRAA